MRKTRRVQTYAPSIRATTAYVRGSPYRAAARTPNAIPKPHIASGAMTYLAMNRGIPNTEPRAVPW